MHQPGCNPAKNLFIIAASIFLVSVHPAFSAELTILTENLPPLNYVKGGVLVGLLARKRDILVAKKGAGIKIISLEDAKKVKRIGTLREDTRERLLKSHGFTNFESVSDKQKNAKKLIFGRIELWAYKKPGLKTICELAEVD